MLLKLLELLFGIKTKIKMVKPVISYDKIIADLKKEPIKKEKSQLEVIIDYTNFIKMKELELFYLENDPVLMFLGRNNALCMIRPEVVYRCTGKN